MLDHVATDHGVGVRIGHPRAIVLAAEAQPSVEVFQRPGVAGVEARARVAGTGVLQQAPQEAARAATDFHDVHAAHAALLDDALRETLRDLKALTRGLSAPRVRLSEAAADWQADAAARLAEADITLDWRLDTGADAALDAVQWQALTRVLRELLSNAIAHAKPDALRLRGALHDGWLSLVVEDNGNGRQPERWAAGLGLSGVRRRVRELGGTVQWQERVPCGIRCTLRVPLAPLASPPGSSR